MSLQYSTLSVEQGTQTQKKTETLIPLDRVVDLYNTLFLKIRENTKQIEANTEQLKKQDKDLSNVVDDIYMEMYECLKPRIINKLKDDMVDLKAEINNGLNKQIDINTEDIKENTEDIKELLKEVIKKMINK